MDDLGFNPLIIPVMIFMIPVIAMLGGFVYLIVRTVSRNRVRELEIRERIVVARAAPFDECALGGRIHPPAY